MSQAHGRDKTRILLLGPQLDAVSGVSTHLNQLFASDLRNQFELTHFRVGSEGRRESQAQKLIRLMSSPFLLGARIISGRHAIVHINASLDHKSFPRDAAYLIVAKALRRRVIFQIHGGELPALFYPNGPVRTRLLERVLRSADLVVLLAQSELEAYSAFVPGVTLRVIPNAIKAAALSELPQKPESGPLRLAYVGRLVATKGVADCIAAAHLLSNEGRDFKLTIAGTGAEEAALRQQAGILVDENRVEFVGALHGEAKEKLWRESHVFTFPTSHLEGLPYSLLEAMAAGAVPITTRMGAQPDVLEDGVHGLFIPPGNPQALFEAIVRLDDDRTLLSLMSANCRQRISDHYTVDRLSAEFEGVYESLMSEH